MAGVILNGSTSGSVTLDPPAVAGSTVITLPSTSGTMALAGGAGSFTTLDASGVSTFNQVNVKANQIIGSGSIYGSPAESGYGSLQLYNYSSGNMAFDLRQTASITFATGTSGTERMRIDSNGNFLIGKTSVESTTKGLYIQMSGGGQVGCTAAADSPLSLNRLTNDGTIVEIRQGGTSRGSISVSGATTSYNTSSDYRLKENIAPMVGALDIVSALNPVTYNWKLNGSDGQGFIAHELANVVPDCVTGEKDAVDDEGNPVYQGIDTSFLVATLTAAIQELAKATSEQQALIENLTTRLSALENK